MDWDVGEIRNVRTQLRPYELVDIDLRLLGVAYIKLELLDRERAEGVESSSLSCSSSSFPTSQLVVMAGVEKEDHEQSHPLHLVVIRIAVKERMPK